jgi:N-methylhydantoinase B/oxoprolinase/acetone carboxylase alpha subunit
VGGNVLTSQRVTDVILTAFKACANSQVPSPAPVCGGACAVVCVRVRWCACACGGVRARVRWCVCRGVCGELISGWPAGRAA